MGEIANQMINGEICAECGGQLLENEAVFVQETGNPVTMPENGDGFGIPVICSECKNVNG